MTYGERWQFSRGEWWMDESGRMHWRPTEQKNKPKPKKTKDSEDDDGTLVDDAEI